MPSFLGEICVPNTALKAQFYQVLRTACLVPIMIGPQVHKELYQDEEQDPSITVATCDLQDLLQPLPC